MSSKRVRVTPGDYVSPKKKEEEEGGKEEEEERKTLK